MLCRSTLLHLSILSSIKAFSIFHVQTTRSVHYPTFRDGTRNDQKTLLQSSLNEGDSDEEQFEETPDFVESIVLKQVYPAMVRHKKTYGNPNIPLGSSDGKKVKTLRRLAFQNKLNENEVDLLKSLDFRFNNLEDIYEEADFDECLDRLLEYEKENNCNYQIPKKYKSDPELGAWVTMVRRIGEENLPSDEVEKLNNINFSWVSTRKCGSAFMTNYRPLKERLDKCCTIVNGEVQVSDEIALEFILNDEEVKRWIRAQVDAAKNNNLSDARCDYMDQLPGLSWRDFNE